MSQKIENKPEWSKSNSLNSKEYEILKNEIKKKTFHNLRLEYSTFLKKEIS